MTQELGQGSNPNPLESRVNELEKLLGSVRDQVNLGKLEYGQPHANGRLRQRVVSPELTAPYEVTDVAPENVTGLVVTINSRGGRLVISVHPSMQVGGAGDIEVDEVTALSTWFFVLVDVNGTAQLAEIRLGQIVATNNNADFISPNALSWQYQPPPGLYTFQLQAYVDSADTSVFFSGNANGGLFISVEEWEF